LFELSGSTKARECKENEMKYEAEIANNTAAR
jgi:hypothetical protein